MVQQDSATAKDIFDRLAPYIAILIPFCIPLKLSVTYAVLIPSLLLWLIVKRKTILKSYKDCSLIHPLHLFVLCAAFSSLFGLNPVTGLTGLGKLFFFSLMIVMFSDIKISPLKPIVALLAGQAISSLHTIFEGGYGALPQFFIGDLSESGQIAQTLILGICVFCCIPKAKSSLKTITAAVIFFTLYCCVAFAEHIPSYLFWMASILSAFIVLHSLINLVRFLFTKIDAERYLPKLKLVIGTAVLPLISVALLENLKRGPWLGVFVGASIFLFIFRRRFTVVMWIAVIAIFLSFQPLQTRLFHSVKDFNIAGGRSVMWQVGADISTRFPMGVGFKNSRIQQKFAPEIPHMHAHQHNNFLNILLETGWLGLAIFCWWLCRIIYSAFRQERMLAIGIACSIISMMVAGIFEYNFGDSEVCLILYLSVGLLSAMRCSVNEKLIADC